MHPSTKNLMTGLCMVILAGCGVTKPSRFYILTPIDDSSAQAMTAHGPSLGIGPVTFPAYLDRPEIVHRSGDNQLHFEGSQRWAEPLKSTFIYTLAENLSILLPTDWTSRYPWPRSARIDYQVIVNVVRFDADATGTVVLTASWEVTVPADKTVIKRHKTTCTEAAGSMEYPAIVAAQSRALERLSREIADAIRHTLLPVGQRNTD
jgi:uncharacterized lipoprotein YmbA